MDLLDGLDDDGDGDVDNPIEIEARTASVLKPVEPDQSEQAQAAVAEEVTEGAKRKVRKERKSRSLKIYFYFSIVQTKKNFKYFSESYQ